ncbi:MAG: hypothetical protein AAB497_01125 [Patescibacteria group bacterium]
MSIEDITKKIKGLFAHKGDDRGFTGFRLPKLNIIPDDLFLGLVVVLVAFGSFGLGRLSKIEGAKTPIRIENAPEVTADTFKTSVNNKKGLTNTAQSASVIGATTEQLVASKSGKKYYYPWCAGVQKIKEENRIYFASKSEAETRGYTPSATCKGL